MNSNHNGREAAWLLLASALIVGSLIVLQWGLKYPYANDSAGYIQEALGLLEGRGLTRGAAWDDVEHAYAAFPLFPPGFSFATAGFVALGLSAPLAALLISWLAWLFIAPAAAWAVRPLVGRGPARAVGLLAVASPGFAEWGFQALSDAPMTLASILSLGVLAQARNIAEPRARAWALSGLFAGLAYLFRNAGAVLPLAIIALLGLAWLARRLSIGALLRAGAAWGAAFALCAFPLFAYNYATFGSIQPYFAAHGTLDYGLLNAVRVSLWSLLLDLTGWRFVADIAWNGKILVALVSLVLFAAWRLARRHEPAFPFAGAILLVYSLIGCALVVWGRSRFDWVETTLTRQFIPYAWAILALGAWALHRLAGRHLRALGWGAIVFLIAGRALGIAQEYARESAIRDAVHQSSYVETARAHPDWVLTPRIKLDVAADRALIALLRELPPDAYIVSNQGALLSVASGRVVRTTSLDAADLMALNALRPQLGGRVQVLVALPSNTRLHQADAAHWQREALDALGHGAHVLHRSPRALVVRLP
jgi:4-amino-4-deoxy-L-arabinose transferase-like glycosyltransferase